MATLQNESNRRSAIENRLHAQLLLQAETLIAMEVKLLKLEAKVEKREENTTLLRRRISNSNVSGVSSGGNVGDSGGGSNLVIGNSSNVNSGGGEFNHHRGSTMIMGSGLENDTIEEDDVFEMREIRVNTNESHSRNLRSGGNASSINRTRSGTNIAVISSGASLASGVTATSFLDGLEAHDDTHTHGDDGASDGASDRSGDGDVEDEGDNGEEHEHDGSASSKCYCYCYCLCTSKLDVLLWW